MERKDWANAHQTRPLRGRGQRGKVEASPHDRLWDIRAPGKESSRRHCNMLLMCATKQWQDKSKERRTTAGSIGTPRQEHLRVERASERGGGGRCSEAWRDLRSIQNIAVINKCRRHLFATCAAQEYTTLVLLIYTQHMC